MNVAKSSALVLIRTPLQAHIARSVLRAEKIHDYDLIFVSPFYSEEARFYFEELSRGARYARHIVDWRKVSAIIDVFLLLLRLKHLSRRRVYEFGLLASLDSIPLLSIALSKTRKLISFDDGSLNIDQTGYLHQGITGWKQKFVRLLFGSPSIDGVKSEIHKHYTLFDGLENIVEEKRLVVLPGWNVRRRSLKSRVEPVTFFIGSPFKEDLSRSQLESLVCAAEDFTIDYYVTHPRELEPLNLGIPLLNKNGRIAEEAILRKADGRKFHLVGGVSTVLFNLGSAELRTLLWPARNQSYDSLLLLAEKLDMQVVRFE